MCAAEIHEQSIKPLEIIRKLTRTQWNVEVCKKLSYDLGLISANFRWKDFGYNLEPNSSLYLE